MAWLESHHGGVLTSQLQLQQDEALTDLTLRLGDGEVRTCRLTVASLSRVFYRMLATDMRERNGGLLTLELVSREDWHCILSFYMSGNKLVTPDNVEALLAIAHLYELDALLEHCSQVLVGSLTSENCCTRLATSKTYAPFVTATIMDYIMKHYDAMCQTDAFTTLTKDDVLKLLHSPGAMTTEESLCDSLLKWLEANSSDEETTTAVLSLLHFNKVSTEYLFEKLMYRGLVMSNARLQQTIKEELIRRSGSLGKSQNDISKYRLPKCAARDIVVFGHSNHGVHNYSLREDENVWKELPFVRVKNYFASHMVGDTVYVTGGQFSAKSTHMFHIESKTWSRGPDLVQGRHVHGMASINESLYVVAGSSERNLASVEKHDLGSDRWDKIGDLQVATELPGVAVVNDVIIVAGGWNSPDVIQTFNVKTRAAAVLDTRLPCRMKRARGVSLAGRAVFLGEDGDLVHVSLSNNSVSVTRHAHLPNFGSRGFFGLMVQGQRLLCIGGGVGIQESARVDCYSLEGEPLGACGLPQLPRALNVEGVFLANIASL